MRSIIEISPTSYQELLTHLIKPTPRAEEAGFLFAQCAEEKETIVLRVEEMYLARPNDFAVRTLGHLELRHEAQERMIKRAHDLASALVEVHSHPYFEWDATAFSFTDRAGLKEIVPATMWRLPGRPYAAIVVTPYGFDALLWTAPKEDPRTIDEMRVGGQRLTPSGRTLERPWKCHGTA